MNDRDHWEIYAEHFDLTIEGHRLIAQEIICEVKALGRWLARAWHGPAGTAMMPAAITPRRPHTNP